MFSYVIQIIVTSINYMFMLKDVNMFSWRWCKLEESNEKKIHDSMIYVITILTVGLTPNNTAVHTRDLMGLGYAYSWTFNIFPKFLAPKRNVNISILIPEYIYHYTSERKVWKYPFRAYLVAEYTAWPGAGDFPAALLICK